MIENATELVLTRTRMEGVSVDEPVIGFASITAATIGAVRGGLPTAITHVYSIGVIESPAEYDDELLKVHLQQAADALPGPDYYAVLRWIHEILRPANYLEIGFRRGDSLRAALPDTRCVAIDPVPDLAAPLPPSTQVLAISSDTFFQRYDLPQLLDASPLLARLH